MPIRFRRMFGLALRLLRHKYPAGRAAMRYAILGLLLMPLDLFLSLWEHRLYRKANSPEQPIIFVCGPPRSGTTLVAQTLIKHLPLYYFNNFTSLFPNAPLVATKLFGRKYELKNTRVGQRSLYGRTKGLWAPNDALYFWDRWRGNRRHRVPEKIEQQQTHRIKEFFGAVESHSGKGLINKNNSLFTYAHIIAEILPTAHFVCLDRQEVYLAQSLLEAAWFIHADQKLPYGMQYPEIYELSEKPIDSGIEQLAETVTEHKRRIQVLRSKLGPNRLTLVAYEEFCENPGLWLKKIATVALGENQVKNLALDAIQPFPHSNTRKVNTKLFSALEAQFKSCVK